MGRRINEKRLIANFIKMVEIDSVSGKEGGFRDFLKNEFSLRGFDTYEDEAGQKMGTQSGNLLVKIPGTVEKSPVLFSAHMDTVIPGEGIKAFIDGEAIRSSGQTILGSDDKAGIAAIMEAIDVLREEKLVFPPLELLFTVREEQGLLGAKHFNYELLKAKKGYALDAGGPPGVIITQSPCQNEIEYIVHGRAAHAGINPEDGKNAIQIMARALVCMPCGRIDSETTCNFGIIEGGKARNIVAETCRVKGEARSLKRQKLDKISEELKTTFQQEVEKNGGRAEINVEFLYPEANLDSREEVVQLAAKAAEIIGLQVELQGTGGGSDASIINGQNIRCANLGVGMSNVHTCDEYIRIVDLLDDAEWVLAIMLLAAK